VRDQPDIRKVERGPVRKQLRGGKQERIAAKGRGAKQQGSEPQALEECPPGKALTISSVTYLLCNAASSLLPCTRNANTKAGSVFTRARCMKMPAFVPLDCR
jgi:hypothetical protein